MTNDLASVMMISFLFLLLIGIASNKISFSNDKLTVEFFENNENNKNEALEKIIAEENKESIKNILEKSSAYTNENESFKYGLPDLWNDLKDPWNPHTIPITETKTALYKPTIEPSYNYTFKSSVPEVVLDSR
jgi:hypothetical protein